MRRASPRRLSFVLGLAVASVAGAAGTATLVAASGSHGGHVSFDASQYATVAGSELTAGRALAPSGGDPWSVSTWKLRDGRRCEAVGQVSAGRFGYRDETGAFKEYDRSYGGACSDSDPPLRLHFTSRATAPGAAVGTAGKSVTLVWGVARSDVRRVTVVGPGGVRVLAPAANGAFVAAFDGSARRFPFTVAARLADGSTHAILRELSAVALRG